MSDDVLSAESAALDVMEDAFDSLLEVLAEVLEIVLFDVTQLAAERRLVLADEVDDQFVWVGMRSQEPQVLDRRPPEDAARGKHQVVEALEELRFVAVLVTIHKPIAVEKTAFVVNHPNRVSPRRLD